MRGGVLRWVATAAVGGGFLGLMLWDLNSRGQVECSVCVEFGGRTECADGRGPTRDDAIEAGHTPACALLAQGVTEAFQCSATPPLSVRCDAD